MIIFIWPIFLKCGNSRDRIVVSTLRCGRSNPGSNPGHGILFGTLSFPNLIK